VFVIYSSSERNLLPGMQERTQRTKMPQKASKTSQERRKALNTSIVFTHHWYPWHMFQKLAPYKSTASAGFWYVCHSNLGHYRVVQKKW